MRGEDCTFNSIEATSLYEDARLPDFYRKENPLSRRDSMFSSPNTHAHLATRS